MGASLKPALPSSDLKKGLLLGIGNPLLDISATVDEDLLNKYDMKPDDAIMAEEKHKPLYRELVDRYVIISIFVFILIFFIKKLSCLMVTTVFETLKSRNKT